MQGKRTEAKNLPIIMTMQNCCYVATATTAFLDDDYAKLEKAIEVAKTGMADEEKIAPVDADGRGARPGPGVVRRPPAMRGPAV